MTTQRIIYLVRNTKAEIYVCLSAFNFDDLFLADNSMSGKSFVVMANFIMDENLAEFYHALL